MLFRIAAIGLTVASAALTVQADEAAQISKLAIGHMMPHTSANVRQGLKVEVRVSGKFDDRLSNLAAAAFNAGVARQAETIACEKAGPCRMTGTKLLLVVSQPEITDTSDRAQVSVSAQEELVNGSGDPVLHRITIGLEVVRVKGAGWKINRVLAVGES